MAKANVWTVPYGDGWANRREDSARMSRIFATKAEAMAAGHATAMRDKVEHIILNRQADISEARHLRLVT